MLIQRVIDDRFQTIEMVRFETKEVDKMNEIAENLDKLMDGLAGGEE